MKKCSRLGLNVGFRCNWNCTTCFYHHFDRSEKANNAFYSFEKMKPEIDAAKARGCDHVVYVGEGEPTLNQDIVRTTEYITSIGLTSSTITNGTGGIEKYEAMLRAGLNHLHISTHGLGDKLNQIAENKNAYEKQLELKKWLKAGNYPWRSNTTLQLINYEQLQEIAEENISYGCEHFVLLNFLPHYQWTEPSKMRTVAVHPAILKSYIQKTIDTCLSHNVMTTLRYFPMCHLDEPYRKYVTNARHVLYDPWEWEYGHHAESDSQFLNSAIQLGEAVANQGAPCNQCTHRVHCGGWNRFYTDGFQGADLKAITEPVDQTFGFLFNQNIANAYKGWF